MAATAASCYEAAFDTSALPPGSYNATVTTTWGASAPFGLVVEAPDGPTNPTEIDVTKDCGGDLPTAMKRAAAVAAGGGTSELVLGAYNYAVVGTLKLPAGTTLRGVLLASA